MAALEVNNHFGTEFTSKHVRHHMKSLRTHFFDMKTCHKLSGAGWDADTNTIIMDVESLNRWREDKSNCRLKDYINKPLLHYEDLATIIGDDQARGDFAKDVAQSIGGCEPINLGDDEDNDPDIHFVDDNPS